jgi:hypothetical protein
MYVSCRRGFSHSRTPMRTGLAWETPLHNPCFLPYFGSYLGMVSQRWNSVLHEKYRCFRARDRLASNQVVGSSNLSGRNDLRAACVGNYGLCGKSLYGARHGQVAFVDPFGGFRARVPQEGLSFRQSCFIRPGLGSEIMEGEAGSSGIDKALHKPLPYR